MDLAILSIAKGNSGGNTSGGGPGGGDDQMVVTVQWNQAAGKFEASKTYDEIIEHIIGGNYDIIALVYDYPPTETNNSARLYSLNGWAYDSTMPKEYLGISFINATLNTADSTLSINSIVISGTNVVTRTNKNIN